MREMNVEGIELNLSSNLALGNIEDVNDEALQRTIELCRTNGIPIFIGTDGYGVYRSTPKELSELARNAGLNLGQIISDEWEYLEDRRTLRAKIIQRFSNDKNGLAKKRIQERLKFLGINELQGQDDKSLKGSEAAKLPIIIAGGSFKTRSDGNIDEYRELSLAMQVLVDVIKPGACYFVTGGTNCGPERFLHRALQNRDNSSSKSKMKCIGLIPSYAGRIDSNDAIDCFDKIDANTVTGAIIDYSYNGWSDFAESLIKMANNTYNLSKNSVPGPKGMCIFVGGGETVDKEIDLASQCGVKSFCYKGFGDKSASSKASNNENRVGFTNAESLIQQIYNFFGKEIFINGFDINKLLEYIERAKKKVTLDYQLFYDTLLDEGNFLKEQLDMIKSYIESGRTQDIGTIFKDKSRLELKDLNLFISAYSTYLKERSADEMPKKFTDDVEGGLLGKIKRKIMKKIRNWVIKEDKNNGDR